MDTPHSRGQVLSDHLLSPDGQKQFQAVQIIAAVMLLGALVAGVAFGVIIGLGAEKAPGPEVPTDAPTSPGLPMLGLVSLTVGLGGAIAGLILRFQISRRNRAILNREEEPFLPTEMLRSTMTVCLVAGALLEGPVLLSFLLAMVGGGLDRTLCLGVALALLAWWALNLPTRSSFWSLLGLESDGSLG